MTLAAFTTEQLQEEIRTRLIAKGATDDYAASAQEAVAIAFEIEPEQLTAARGTAYVAQARFALYWILRKRGYSLNDIAAITRRKDHGSVIHGLRQAEAIGRTNPRFLEAITKAKAAMDRRAAA